MRNVDYSQALNEALREEMLRDENVFVIEVAKHALLCVVYRDHDAPGLITRWTRSAANRLEKHYDALTEARVF